MLRIDRSRVSEVLAMHLNDDRDNQAKRRERNAAAGNCINETNAGTHGIATHGRLCRRCRAVHRYGAEVVRARGVDALIPPNEGVIADRHDRRAA